MPLVLRPKIESELDHRKAVLSLRWLLVILASYLTLFSYVNTRTFPYVFGIAIGFSFSNVVLMLIPRQVFFENKMQVAVAVFDVLFVAATLYLLRVPENYVYV